MSGKGLTSVPLLRDVTPASDSAVSLRWFFKVDVVFHELVMGRD